MALGAIYRYRCTYQKTFQTRRHTQERGIISPGTDFSSTGKSPGWILGCNWKADYVLYHMCGYISLGFGSYFTFMRAVLPVACLEMGSRKGIVAT